MLAEAAALTIELATALLELGAGLKDATPYNVLFRGTQPVFVDVLSFEERQSGDPVWLPFAQFGRTFILPLLLYRETGRPTHEAFLAGPDGIEPQQAVAHLTSMRRLKWLSLKYAVLPTLLNPTARARGAQLYEKRQRTAPEAAGFVLRSLFRSLRNNVRGLTPGAGKSSWSAYSDSQHLTDDYVTRKTTLVTAFLERTAPKRVLDVGANVGFYSKLAARTGASVVAIDSDAASVGTIWRDARAEGLDILPLVVDFSRPTPAAGWRNREQLDFLTRAIHFQFDSILMLAVIHHLCVTERIPLDQVFALCAELTAKALVIEFVSAADPMFKRILRGRDDLHAEWTQTFFEHCFSRYFVCEEKHELSATRHLYLLNRRAELSA